MKRSVILFGSIFSAALTLYAQPQQPPSVQRTAEEKRQIQSKTDELDAIVQKLKAKHGNEDLLADVEVYGSHPFSRTWLSGPGSFSSQR